MNSGEIFEPYDRDYESGYRYHGKANYNAVLSELMTQPSAGDNFGENTFPYMCYAYGSVNNKIAHVQLVNWSDEKLTIPISPVSNDGYIKHFVACTSDCPVSDLIGDTDRITNIRFNQNLQRYNPLNIDFEWTRFGLQACVINTETLQESIVYSIDELKSLDEDKHVVKYTKCRNFYKDARTDEWGGFVDYDNTVSLVFNCNDTILYCRGKGNDNVRYGINVVPRFGIGANNRGQPTYSDTEYSSADTGIELIGLDWNENNEIVIPTNNVFNYLENGGVMQVTGAGSDYKNLNYRLTIKQTLKELAYTGLIFCHDSDPHSNLYAGYIDPDGLATGELIPYEDWNKTDSLNVKNKYMTDFPDLHIKPPPTPTDIDDTEKMNIGGYYSAGGLVNYYSLVNTPDYRPLDLLSANLSSWDYVATGKDVLKNLVSLKAFPISRELICRGTTTEITIAGTQTGVNGQTVDSTYSLINLGSITIPHRYNDFRDYAPYTKIEICCPFVGWMTIPSHCMGHNIDVKMTYDIITGSCTVYVLLDSSTIVCQSNGCIAFDIPFTADAVGMKTAGMISGITGVAGSALSLGTGLVSGNIVGSASGIIGLANSITQTICTNNANYTEVKGATGDSNSFAGVKQCYLKITYPVSHLPDNFDNSVGYLFNKNTTLTEGMGFTKTTNTKITGPMTESELNEIISLMETGVIL